MCNPTGKFGNPGSDVSIHNPNSIYGSPPGGDITSPTFNSRYSAFNSSADDPPRMVLNDNLIAWVSANPGLNPRVHPDTLFFHLGCPY